MKPSAPRSRCTSPPPHALRSPRAGASPPSAFTTPPLGAPLEPAEASSESIEECLKCQQPLRKDYKHTCSKHKSLSKRHASPAGIAGTSRQRTSAPVALTAPPGLAQSAASPRIDTTSRFEGVFTISLAAGSASPPHATSATAGPSVLTLASTGTTATPADVASELGLQEMHTFELHEQQRVAEVAGDGAATGTPLAGATAAGEAAPSSGGAQESGMVNTLPKWEARRHMHQFGHLEGSSRRATDDDMEPTGSIVFELVAVLQDGERVTVTESAARRLPLRAVDGEAAWSCSSCRTSGWSQVCSKGWRVGQEPAREGKDL